MAVSLRSSDRAARGGRAVVVNPLPVAAPAPTRSVAGRAACSGSRQTLTCRPAERPSSPRPAATGGCRGVADPHSVTRRRARWRGSGPGIGMTWARPEEE